MKIGNLDTEKLQWRPGNATHDGSNVKAIPYIDARQAMDELDKRFPSWQFNWEMVYHDTEVIVVKGKLTINGVTREDVGSVENVGADSYKAAVSDALKRAAVQCGIFREVYDLPDIWVPAKEIQTKKGTTYVFADPNDPHRTLLAKLQQQQKQTAPEQQVEKQVVKEQPEPKENEVDYDEVPYEPPTTKQIGKICAQGRNYGLDSSDLHTLLGIGSFNDISKHDLSSWIELFNGNDDNVKNACLNAAKQAAIKAGLDDDAVRNIAKKLSAGKTNKVALLSPKQMIEFIRIVEGSKSIDDVQPILEEVEGDDNT